MSLFPFDAKDTVSCLAWLGMVRPSKGLPPKKLYLPKIRAEAIQRLVAAIRTAENRCDDSIPLSDAKEILSRWLL
jgi:hypothetical protein